LAAGDASAGERRRRGTSHAWVAFSHRPGAKPFERVGQMRIEGSEARARIMRLNERLAMLEAALEQCRTLAARATSDTAVSYCEQIEQVAGDAVERQGV
jgi:hypothetical protein